MIKRFYALRIVGTYAAAEQEGRRAMIIGEHAPVELLSTASWSLCLSIEKEVVDKALVGLGGFKVGSSGDVKGLDDGEVRR